MDRIKISDIEITVIKKKIKNIYIRVLPPDGTVQITAPYGTGEDTIRRLAVSRITWIEKQKEKIQSQIHLTERRYADGESCYVWGKRCCLDVRYSDVCHFVQISDGKLILQVSEDSTPEQREKILNEWYRKQLKQEIPEILEKCENIVGVKCAEWQVKNMKTRWGTCNTQQRRIWLNLQLAKKTPECLAYVITHELVHLLERSHNDRFRGYMDQFFPDWQRVKEILNQQPVC